MTNKVKIPRNTKATKTKAPVAKKEVEAVPPVSTEDNTKVQVKRILQSKTIWVNVIAFVGFILQNKYGFVMSEDLEMQLLTIINILLRFVTHEKISWGGEDKDGNS